MADESPEVQSEVAPEVTVETQPPVGAPTEVPTSKKTAYFQLREETAASVTADAPSIRGLVVKELAERENEKRKASVLKVLDKIDEKYKEIRKLENEGTPSAFDLKGNRVGEMTFTKQQLEAIKKAKEELQKLEGALEKAFGEKPDFQRVLELGK